MLEDQIANRFGANSVALRLIRDGQGGASVYEAHLDGVKYALRISGPFLSARPSWVEFEGGLLRRAGEESVAVARAFPGTDCKFGQIVDGGLAFLTEWADGDVEWPTPPTKAGVLGRAVAHLHRATETVRFEESLRPFDTAGLLDRPLNLLNEVADAEPLRLHVEAMRERIDAIPKTHETFGPIHGDVHQGNCHFNGNVATLFDFAQCGFGWRAFDLAGFLWPWRDKSIEKPELRSACDAYLAGYQSVRPLTPEERHALPAFIRARNLWEAGEWVATGDAREKPNEVAAGIRSWASSWGSSPLPNESPFLTA